MKRMLRIADIVDGVFVDVPRILAPLAPDAYALRWRIIALGEVVAEERWDLNLPFIERAVWETPEGLELSFEELILFAQRVRRVIDGLFVGAEGGLPRRTDSDATILSQSEMTVAAVDSSFWLVSAPESVLSRFQEEFERVTEEDPPFVWRRD